MTTPPDCKYRPCAKYRFFLYDPNGDFTFWKNEQERDEYAARLIPEYLDEGEWNDEVTLIFAGTVTRHIVEADRKDRVGELDEDGCDKAGEYWGSNDYDYRCDHALKPLPAFVPTPSQQP